MKTIKYVFVALGSMFCLIGCKEILEEVDISESEVSVLGPKNNTVVKQNAIQFNWEYVADASLYQIQLATPNFEHAAQVLIDSVTEKNSYSKILTPNAYEWRVRALNSAYATPYTTNGFTVLKNTDFEKSSVTLVEPKDNFYTNNKTLNFSWEVVVDALEYRFRMQKENQTTFDTILKSNSLEKILEDGNYSWEVRGQIATINTLFSKRDFIVDTEVPNKATLTNPANNAQEDPASIRFQWERESKTGSPELDSIFIYTDANLSSLLLKEQGTNKQFESEMETGMYYWLIQSFDLAGNKGEKSETFKLEIN